MTVLRLTIIAWALIISGAACAESGDEWETHKSRYFLIHYQNAPSDFVKSVEKAAIEYYRQIARNMGFTRYKNWTYDDRAEIYIYDDQEHYVEASRGPGWSSGHAFTKSKIIRTFPAAHGFFDSTLPHELGHIIFREFVGEKAQVPRWFEEGVAMYQEKAKRWGANKEVLDAIENGYFLSIKDLNVVGLRGATDRRVVNLFYAESASIVYYLITEWGKTRFIRLCRKLQDGTPFMWAFKSIYPRFKDLDDLNDAWLDYLKDD